MRRGRCSPGRATGVATVGEIVPAEGSVIVDAEIVDLPERPNLPVPTRAQPLPVNRYLAMVSSRRRGRLRPMRGRAAGRECRADLAQPRGQESRNTSCDRPYSMGGNTQAYESDPV